MATLGGIIFTILFLSIVAIVIAGYCFFKAIECAENNNSSND